MAKTSLQKSGSADALALARAAADGPPILVLAASAQDAERLREEIAWFDPTLAVHRLPDWEILPYDQFSPHPDLVSERLSTLWQFSNGDFRVGIVPVTTALQRLPPRSYVAGRTFNLKAKARLDLEALRAQMVLAGYHHVQQVMSPGEFCVRGGIVDLFPTGSAVPYRLDLMADEIETIRTFDVDTQRSIYPVSEVRMLPAREFPLDEEGRNHFRNCFRERFEGDPTKSRVYKDVSNGVAPAGVEAYLPLFFESTATLFDYLPHETRLITHGEVGPAAEAFWKDLKSRHELLRGDRDRPLMEPRELYLPVEEMFVALDGFERAEAKLDAAEVPAVEVDRRSIEPLKNLARFTESFGGRTLIVAESPGRRETLSSFFSEHGFHPALVDDWNRFRESAHPVAVADYCGKLELFLASGDVTALATVRAPGAGESATSHTVNVITIDSLLNEVSHVDFVKVDVEGAEYKVLLGMQALIARDHPILTIELSDAWLAKVGSSARELIHFLTERGYAISWLDGDRIVPLTSVPAEQVDVVCVPAARS